MTGCVFDIKEFSVHDGPGGRTTVFLKGCPLRCLWCHNPEGLSPKPQLMVRGNLCTKCGRCRVPCEHSECAPFGRCLHACPNGLVSVSGRVMTPCELADELRPQKAILEANGGGITFSGGEPLMQPGFVCETADLLPGFHKAVQTSGYAAEEVFREVVSRMDYVMMDIKCADPIRHKELTGVSNERILGNLEVLRSLMIPFTLRVPLIPGLTDTEENLAGISEIAGSDPVELLKYNPFAGAKYSMLGMKYPLGDDLKNGEIKLSMFRNARFG